MINIGHFISNIPSFLEKEGSSLPWEITANIKSIIEEMIPNLGEDFKIENGIAIHKSATLEHGITIKGPAIIMDKCHICTNAYLREGVFLDSSVKIGPSSEIKSSMIFSGSAIAHLNYIGNSLIGRNVNFEGGSIAANHYNERVEKKIRVIFKDQVIDTGTEKFGALVGDGSKIGANGVLSPGTILEKGSIVKRLELIEQLKEP
ncbi:LpxA family transferase [Flagellimonas pelagia]|uniref:LpxA family transferase n=1 Tax=Flagellimonas pelagia TaxID=2306998 RepID=A0A3A1NPR8_9FLAO|nr:LpxA family transferase [Allomuricauda maritima]RIV47174.1 LpxA family transferase [Allomuricauda maritima]TXK00873.1 LpxA family transferase [Allomuricauda maritima]